MRDAIISALALMDETDAISCLLEATREREANHRAEMRRRLIQAEEERDTAEGAGVIISIICDVFEVDESDLRGSARGSRIWEILWPPSNGLDVLQRFSHAEPSQV